MATVDKPRKVTGHIKVGDRVEQSVEDQILTGLRLRLKFVAYVEESPGSIVITDQRDGAEYEIRVIKRSR